MSEWPELQYYKIAVSRNGGPMAMMLQENTFFFGKKDNTKNIIFIFSSFGKLIQIVNVSACQLIYLFLSSRIKYLKASSTRTRSGSPFTSRTTKTCFSSLTTAELSSLTPRLGSSRTRKRNTCMSSSNTTCCWIRGSTRLPTCLS